MSEENIQHLCLPVSSHATFGKIILFYIFEYVFQTLYPILDFFLTVELSLTGITYSFNMLK